MTKKRRTTIRDVASSAGVSIATVSKFMHKLQRYSPEIEARIRHAVEELDYHQSLATRDSIVGQTRALALAVQDVHNPYFTNIFGGASRVALENEYNLLIVNLRESPSEEQRLLAPLSSRVDGFIITSRNPEEDWLHKLGKPVVCMGSPARKSFTTVRADSYRGGYLMGQHLLQTGRQRIAFLGLKSYVGSFQGLSAVLAESGLPPPIRYNAPGPTLDGGVELASTILLQGTRPDAVVCRNDLLAIGLINAAQSFGLRVPEDVAITGCDNIPVARYIQPSLTTLDMRCEEQGEIAMRRLLAAILQKDSVEDIMLEPRLIIGKSSGRPKAMESKISL